MKNRMSVSRCCCDAVAPPSTPVFNYVQVTSQPRPKDTTINLEMSGTTFPAPIPVSLSSIVLGSDEISLGLLLTLQGINRTTGGKTLFSAPYNSLTVSLNSSAASSNFSPARTWSLVGINDVSSPPSQPFTQNTDARLIAEITWNAPVSPWANLPLPNLKSIIDALEATTERATAGTATLPNDFRILMFPYDNSVTYAESNEVTLSIAVS